MANIHYVDDQGRAIWGYTGWARDGRPLAEMLMIALNFNMHITDLFPFPAILSVFLISVCLYFLAGCLYRQIINLLDCWFLLVFYQAHF
ncbi:glucosyltransferase domain-containing protein [Escherichia coli]|uniref:glucosyltransferase domain-containing protein n=1 Tax=Escherichia coli TaxID=562 RepID=UPI003D807804